MRLFTRCVKTSESLSSIDKSIHLRLSCCANGRRGLSGKALLVKDRNGRHRQSQSSLRISRMAHIASSPILSSQERKGNNIVPIREVILGSIIPHFMLENVCAMHDKIEIRINESVSE
mmetsp:Transcript_1545/g.2828  ORF Transcript_1545/g.2828 Transcript_1545/m.2828 type:complete len:118 (-) Transcript_1545:4361-4714(-)